MIRLPRTSLQSVLVASGAIGLAGLVAGAVRILPWLLDPAVPWRVAAPFARGLTAVAAEAALLVGWPVGWSLACFRWIETGEARVLQTLGERPLETVRRLLPQGAALAIALAGTALVYGLDAGAPGRVATELVAQGRAACAAAEAPETYSIPFTNLTWLCAPPSEHREPRLVGGAPGALSSVTISARDARIAGDFRSLELDDAHVLFPGRPPVALHVASLSMHGMAPWARASTVPAGWRALLLALTAWAAATLAAHAVLRGTVRSRFAVLVLAAAGPLAALGLFRLLEQANAPVGAFVLAPLVGVACTLAVAEAMTRVRRSPVIARRLLRLRD